MKETAYSHVINATMNSGFVKILQDKLINEDNPFEMRMRRVVSGIWEIEIYTDQEFAPYFRNLINSLV
jgi:hypothetical protein